MTQAIFDESNLSTDSLYNLFDEVIRDYEDKHMFTVIGIIDKELCCATCSTCSNYIAIDCCSEDTIQHIRDNYVKDSVECFNMTIEERVTKLDNWYILTLSHFFND